MLTFRACPICVQIRQDSLIIYLLQRLGGFVINLEDTAGSPSAGGFVPVGHVEVYASSTTRRLGIRVVGNGALKENWGRQLGGVEKVHAKRIKAAVVSADATLF